MQKNMYSLFNLFLFMGAFAATSLASCPDDAQGNYMAPDGVDCGGTPAHLCFHSYAGGFSGPEVSIFDSTGNSISCPAVSDMCSDVSNHKGACDLVRGDFLILKCDNDDIYDSVCVSSTMTSNSYNAYLSTQKSALMENHCILGIAHAGTLEDLCENIDSNGGTVEDEDDPSLLLNTGGLTGGPAVALTACTIDADCGDARWKCGAGGECECRHPFTGSDCSALEERPCTEN